LSLADCRVRDSDMLPGAQGLKAPLACLSQARYGIGWGVIGAAMDCYETARQYSLVRKQFDDRPIASHQLVQEKLAWMITEITKAQLLAVQAGRLPHLDAEAKQRRHGARMRAPQPRPARCERHHRRVSDYASPL
jgi:glutaryl-CoA dehydrogenase